MAPKSPVDRITELLTDDAPEKRIAAAIVLAELKARGPAVTRGLVSMLESGGPPLQRHALHALAAIGPGKALDHVLPLLGSRDADVRVAAVEAVASVGEAALAPVRARLEQATGEERRALDSVLARLGGKEAFGVLLAALDTDDEEIARRTAVDMRQQIRDADAKTRRSYFAQVQKLLEKLDKRKDAPVAAVTAAVKVLGFLEDDKTVPVLLSYAKGSKRPAAVRQEALIALRFALHGGSAATKVLNALAEAAESDDRTLAQTALITLAGMELSPALASRFAVLAAHPDMERARIAIEKLGSEKGAESTKVLARLLSAKDTRRVELAAAALEHRKDAVPYLVDALAETGDAEHARLFRRILRPHASRITPAMRKKLIEASAEKLGRGDDAWDAPLSIARASDPAKTAAALRDLASKLKKSRRHDAARAALLALVKSDEATDEDRYALVSLELSRSRLDTRPAARRGDDALRMLGDLMRRGYDVASALRRDRNIGVEPMYYVGFHFAEEGVPLGEELLAQVVEKAGRTKIGRAAKNKLHLAGLG